MTWRAMLDDRWDHGPMGVRLHLANVEGDRVTHLMEDGSYQTVSDDGVRIDRAGVLLPRDPEALQAVARALSEHLPAVQEIRRLEEALSIERARVDALLADARKKAFG